MSSSFLDAIAATAAHEGEGGGAWRLCLWCVGKMVVQRELIRAHSRFLKEAVRASGGEYARDFKVVIGESKRKRGEKERAKRETGGIGTE